MGPWPQGHKLDVQALVVPREVTVLPSPQDTSQVLVLSLSHLSPWPKVVIAQGVIAAINSKKRSISEDNFLFDSQPGFLWRDGWKSTLSLSCVSLSFLCHPCCDLAGAGPDRLLLPESLEASSEPLSFPPRAAPRQSKLH